MSSIAKIFIIINFILSIAYMMLAGTLLAQKWDYKTQLIEQIQKSSQEKQVQEQKEKQANAKIESLESTLGDIRKDAIELRGEKQQLDLSIITATTTNDNLNQRLNNLEASYKEINDKIGKKDARISELEASRDKAKEQTEDAIRLKESAEEEEAVVETELNNIKGDIAEKEKTIQKQGRELTELRQIIEAARKRGLNLKSLYSKEKPLDGFITAVSRKLPLVMISLGSDDQVKKGYQFTVYRGNNYVGTVTIEDVYKDASAARVVKDKTRLVIQKGDSVTTRFGG